MKKRAITWMATVAAGMVCLPLLAESVLDRASKSNTNEVRRTEADNTARNVRDRDSMSVTPVDQGSSEADLSLTRQIRQGIVEAKDLSVSGKNVKVITNNGKVILRGPVKTESEKRIIENIAEQVAEKENVNSQLEVLSEQDSASKEQ